VGIRGWHGGFKEGLTTEEIHGGEGKEEVGEGEGRAEKLSRLASGKDG